MESKKVYVVVNESLYETSSYFDVCLVTTKEHEARIYIETTLKDILANNLLGDSVNVFYDDEISKQGFNNDKGVLVMNEVGYYEHLRLEEHEVVE